MLDILIVEDSAAIRKILQRLLRRIGMPVGTILEAGDGLEAIEKLKTEAIGLILSDLHMPKMNGLELLSKIKASETWKNVPVLIVSTEGSQAKVLEAIERGAEGYVRTPFNTEKMKEKLAPFF